MQDIRVQIFRANNVLEDDFQVPDQAHGLTMAYYYCSNLKEDLRIKFIPEVGKVSEFRFIAETYRFI